MVSIQRSQCKEEAKQTGTLLGHVLTHDEIKELLSALSNAADSTVLEWIVENCKITGTSTEDSNIEWN